MATISTTSSVAIVSLVQKGSVSRPSSVVGLPSFGKVGKVRCSMEGKPKGESNLGIGESLMAAAVAAASMSNPTAMALVDERMSTEGTGLPFGLSNNLLGWILFGVFGLIWALYTIYTSGLDEDEESGLSL
ncbi:photosystem II reaction center W protein, chloroplastic [Capsicum galapagoense]